VTKTIRGVVVLAALAAVAVCPPAEAQISVGPDDSGHILTDNPDPSLFSYIDISATGQVLAAGDELSGNVTFPPNSTFYFYGAERTALRASTNGFVSFNLSDGADPSNDCPVPAVPGTGDGSGDRLYVLHDNLVTTVRYQHFPASSNPSGWSGDVSVIQWTGTYVGSGLAVDFELLLLHSLDMAVMLYQTAGEGGSNSTTGIQNAAASTGLNYRCNMNSSIYPGLVVAVGSLALNELRIDQPGADNDEFAEISGVPAFNLGGLSLIAIGDAAGTDSGVIEAAVGLTGTVDTLGGRMFYVVAEPSFTLGTPDQTTLGLNFENQDTVTYVLVSGFTGSLGQDLDTNDDGFLDVAPWSQVVDAVSNLSEAQPPALSEHAYAATTVGPGPLGAPFHIRRCPDVHGPWTIGADDPASGADTPGASNGCVGDLIFADGFEA